MKKERYEPIHPFDFDTLIDRNGTHAVGLEGYQKYLFGDMELRLDVPESDLVHMWVADMDFQTAPVIKEAILDRIDHGIFGYTKVDDPTYYDAFVSWSEENYGHAFNKQHILMTSGIIPALFEIIRLRCKKGDKLLILTPSYAFFKHAADFHGVEVVSSELQYEDGEYQIDFEDVKTKVRDPNLNLCFFCSPHNPTGRIWSDEELMRFGEICLEQGVTIVSDEIHCDLLRQGKRFSPMAKIFPESKEIITCMSTSKTFNLAGLLTAFIIIPNEGFRNIWQNDNFGLCNPLSIAAAHAAYQDGKVWLDALKRYLDDNFLFLKSFLEQYLPQAHFTIPDATYLAWIHIGAYFDKGEDLGKFFVEKAGVVLEGGTMFVENADGYIRLNIACPREKLELALNRMQEAIERRTKG